MSYTWRSSIGKKGRLVPVILAWMIVPVLFCGCDSGEDGYSSSQASAGEKTFLSENDFSNDPSLQALPDQGVVIFLEHAGALVEDNPTGTMGVDIIPYFYPVKTNHTFCWEDAAPGAAHQMRLVDVNGREVLRAEAGGDCQMVSLEPGRYFLHLIHDNQTQNLHMVFIQPQDVVPTVAQKPGLLNKIMAWLEAINPIETAHAATAEENLETLVSTNECMNCDLDGMDLAQMYGCPDYGFNVSGSDLDNAKLNMVTCNADLGYITARNADFSYGVFSECIFSDSDLTTANMQNTNLLGSWLVNTNLTMADLTDADLLYCLLTDANFSYATLDGANFELSIDTGTANFSEASLKGTNFSGLDLSVAGLFTGLDATGADFTGATISGVGMMFVDFTDANFTDADLSGFGCLDSTLTGATLTGADLTGASLDYTGATWTDGSCECADSSCSNC